MASSHNNLSNSLENFNLFWFRTKGLCNFCVIFGVLLKPYIFEYENCESSETQILEKFGFKNQVAQYIFAGMKLFSSVIVSPYTLTVTIRIKWQDEEKKERKM